MAEATCAVILSAQRSSNTGRKRRQAVLADVALEHGADHIHRLEHEIRRMPPEQPRQSIDVPQSLLGWQNGSGSVGPERSQQRLPPRRLQVNHQQVRTEPPAMKIPDPALYAVSAPSVSLGNPARRVADI